MRYTSRYEPLSVTVTLSVTSELNFAALGLVTSELNFAALGLVVTSELNFAALGLVTVLYTNPSHRNPKRNRNPKRYE